MSEPLWNMMVNIFAIIGAAHCAIWAVEKLAIAAKLAVRRYYDR